MSDINVKITEPNHTHLGAKVAVGTVIVVAKDIADWLVTVGKGTIVSKPQTFGTRVDTGYKKEEIKSDTPASEKEK